MGFVKNNTITMSPNKILGKKKLITKKLIQKNPICSGMLYAIR